MAELVDAALHGGTESYMSAAFKIRTGSNPVLHLKSFISEVEGVNDFFFAQKNRQLVAVEKTTNFF